MCASMERYTAMLWKYSEVFQMHCGSLAFCVRCRAVIWQISTFNSRRHWISSRVHVSWPAELNVSIAEAVIVCLHSPKCSRSPPASSHRTSILQRPLRIAGVAVPYGFEWAERLRYIADVGETVAVARFSSTLHQLLAQLSLSAWAPS